MQNLVAVSVCVHVGGPKTGTLWPRPFEMGALLHRFKLQLHETAIPKDLQLLGLIVIRTELH